MPPSALAGGGIFRKPARPEDTPYDRDMDIVLLANATINAYRNTQASSTSMPCGLYSP